MIQVCVLLKNFIKFLVDPLLWFMIKGCPSEQVNHSCENDVLTAAHYQNKESFDGILKQ